MYFCKFKALSNVKKRKLGNKYDSINLFLKAYNYYVWFESEELSDTTETDEKSTDLPPMPPLKGLKILTPNKLVTRLPILLAQTKAGNNSYKLKNEIRQLLYLLCQHNKIIKKVYNNVTKSL